VVILGHAADHHLGTALGHVHHRLIQILPLTVRRFDKLDLPSPVPPFEALLSLNGFLRSYKRLAIDEPVHPVLLRETLNQPLLVLPDPPGKITGYANVQGSVRLAGKNVDMILAAHGLAIVMDSRFRGNDVAGGEVSLW
jgi:hypothetical protein